MAPGSALAQRCSRLAWPVRGPRLSASLTSPSLTLIATTRYASWTDARGFHSTGRRAERRTDGLRDGPSKAAVSSLKSSSSGRSPSDVLSETAFAFDIDGVLYQGGVGIPGAKETLAKVRSQNMRYVFLTNGGGQSEEAKVESLTKRLKFSGDEDVIRGRVILSHTPMRGWSKSAKKDNTVLITGSHPETARKIAEEYGFPRVVTSADIIAANPSVYPFDHMKMGFHSVHRELPDGKKVLNLPDPYTKDVPSDVLKIDQIMVWNDPRDWSLDIQIIHDLLISYRGYLGTVSNKNGNLSLPNNGWQQDGQPDIWVSNLDLLWRTDFPINRFGTGSFVEALKGVWTAVTGGVELQFNAVGKPSNLTYEYAHERLLRYYADMAGVKDTAEGTRPLKRVYMIGDNPESDIRGANDFAPEDGSEWVPILVRTGVWQQTEAEREPKHKPAVIVDDVADAVVWALRNEGLDVDRDWVLSS